MPVYNMCSIKISIYYNFKAELENGGIHPRVEGLSNYLRKNIPEEKLKDFYERIISNCEYMPKKVDLDKILNSLMAIDINYKEPLPDQKQLENHLYEKIGIPVIVEDTKEASLEDVIKQNNIISSKELLNMYGSKKCFSAWYEIGKKMTDDEYEKMKLERRLLVIGKNEKNIEIKGTEYFHD